MSASIVPVFNPHPRIKSGTSSNPLPPRERGITGPLRPRERNFLGYRSCRRRGSKWSRSQSPKKLPAMTTRNIQTPGIEATHQASFR